jgi:Domain of unknown function (DUF4160)
MPEIYRIQGIKIYVYFNDHAPPHIHAENNGAWGVFDIRTGNAITKGKLDRPSIAVVKAWLKKNKAAVMGAWDKVVAGEQPGKINPNIRKQKSGREAGKHNKRPDRAKAYRRKRS